MYVLFHKNLNDSDCHPCEFSQGQISITLGLTWKNQLKTKTIPDVLCSLGIW